ncbi:AAEL014688-PA [Aedes aegypti]|uniref:AAEL014688-PA n=1 Tax=Aedes aegypti TaxID=7159 RepID=Q16FP5_AEDAE|nr:AAEL014688-PA [Aedes aegypti]
MQVLAKKLNFSLAWKNSPGQWGFARPIGKSTGLMKMTQQEKVHFAIGCLAMDPDRYRYLKAGVSHYTSKILFAVPHGRPYTALEKLIGPFQTSVLVMQAFVLLVTCVVVLILRFTNSKVRAFVYGRGTTTPLLNAIAILFGVSISRPPVRNFARTLLFLWLMYGFIFASLYQGSLYSYLQKPMHYPPLKTMQEIDRSGLHYYMVDIGTRFFVHNPSIVRRTIIIPPGKDSLGLMVANLGLNQLTDGVVLTPMDLVAYNNRVNPRSRFVHIAREHVSVFPVGLYYPKQSALRDVFDEQVRMIVPSGLVSYWIERYGDYDFFARPIEKSEPRKLSNAHLVGAYQLYGCCLGVSVGVFLVELTVPRLLALGAFLRRLID